MGGGLLVPQRVSGQGYNLILTHLSGVQETWVLTPNSRCDLGQVTSLRFLSRNGEPKTLGVNRQVGVGRPPHGHGQGHGQAPR